MRYHLERDANHWIAHPLRAAVTAVTRHVTYPADSTAANPNAIVMRHALAVTIGDKPLNRRRRRAPTISWLPLRQSPPQQRAMAGHSHRAQGRRRILLSPLRREVERAVPHMRSEHGLLRPRAICIPAARDFSTSWRGNVRSSARKCLVSSVWGSARPGERSLASPSNSRTAGMHR